jgi:hypothetical protein
MVYVYIASFVGFFASVISMAEIASMYVSQGNCHHSTGHTPEPTILTIHQFADFRWTIPLGQ